MVAPIRRIRQAHAVRLGIVATLSLLCGVASADGLRSDPAFLGIGMSDYPQPGAQAMACQVTSVTPDTGAAAAKLSSGDVIVRIDGVVINSCDELSAIITSHSSGDAVPIELLGKRTIIAQLSSRTEVMRRNLVGRSLDVALQIADAKGLVPLDLAGRGRVTIVGWFDPGCIDCASVFSRIAKWQKAGRANDAYAVTLNRSLSNPTATTVARQFPLDVPVAFTDGNGLNTPIIFDVKRIVFMVIDARGQVSYIGPVAPAADDVDAALDELFLAADHARADHTPSRRAQSSRR